MTKFSLGRLFAEYNNPWAKKRPSGGGGGNNGGGRGPTPFKMPSAPQIKLPRFLETKLPLIVGVLLLIFWLSTGFFIVKPEEQAAILRFGELNRVVGPGPHLAFPYPVEKYHKASVTNMRRLEIGFRSAADRTMTVGKESLMLTGDENIVDIKVIVQYRINDIMAFLFNVRYVSETIKDAAEAAVRETMGGETIDNALTVGKFKIQTDIRNQLQRTLNEYKMGIDIAAVELYDVQPPNEVVQAFKDVASAREDRERLINQAQGYRNSVLPQTRGEVARIMEAARGYKESKIFRSQGDVDRFIALYTEFKQAPEITRDRLLLDVMQEVMPTAKLYLIDSQAGKGILPYLPLQGLKSQ